MLYSWLLGLLAISFDQFVPVTLVVTAVVVSAWLFEYRVVFRLAFLLGILTDVLMLQSLGVSSVVLLLISAAVNMGREQFEWQSGMFVAATGIVGEFVWRVVFTERVSGKLLLLQGLLTIICWALYRLFSRREGVYLKR